MTLLLVLFASYADIFLFRRGIVPVTPAYFLIPLFIILFIVNNNPLNYLSLTRSHSFQFFAGLVVLSIVYATISNAQPDVILTSIVLNIIALILYLCATHFFRIATSNYVGLFLILAFGTLSASLWYDVLIGLPSPTKLVEGSMRKGGFGENPNTAASGLKFLGFALLFFFRKNKVWRIILVILVFASVLLTFSRGGIISMILIILGLSINGWKEEFNLDTKAMLLKLFKAVVILIILYGFLYLALEILKNEIPEIAQGSLGKRIEQFQGKGANSIINEDDTSNVGRSTLFTKYLTTFLENPWGMGTAFAMDSMLNPVGPHNIYLYYSVEYGLIGLFLYLLFLFRYVYIAIKRNLFYPFLFAILMIFEGLISHNTFEERAILLTIAFFDSMLYPFYLNKKEAVSQKDFTLESNS